MPKIGSDGESEEASAASDETLSSNLAVNNVNNYVNTRKSMGCNNNINNHVNHGAVKIRANRASRRANIQEFNKRLSLPANLKLPESFLAKVSLSPGLDGPVSRSFRRQSLSEIGFGKLETYIKLDKLGEVGDNLFIYLGFRSLFFMISLLTFLDSYFNIIAFSGYLCNCIQRSE